MASGGDMPQDGGDDSPYRRNICVRINVGDNKKVKAGDVIKIITDCLDDVDSILGVVPKSGDVFEIALKDRECVRILCPEFEVRGKWYPCSEVVQEDVVVSVIHLPTYVTDEHIRERFEYYGVEIVGEVKRRKYPNTNIVDGTRYMRVRFPPDIKSLPYTIKFFDGENWGYYRVIHNNQVKVCNNCLSEDHIFKFCPENRCYKCLDYGHLAKFCEAERCSECGKYGKTCVCLCDRCGERAGQCSHDDELCTDCGKFECDCSIIEQDNTTLEECIHCGKCACTCPIVENDYPQHVTTTSQDPDTLDDISQRDPEENAVNTDPGVNSTDQPRETESSTIVKTPEITDEREVTEPDSRADRNDDDNQQTTIHAVVHSEPKADNIASATKKNGDSSKTVRKIATKTNGDSAKNGRKSDSECDIDNDMDATTSLPIRRRRLNITPNVSVARNFSKRSKKDDEIEMSSQTES